MRPGQNPLVILTALEEMAAQLSQQIFPVAPDQALLQFLTILPDSEYEVEKRTYSTGQRLDRDQVLLMFRTRYDNLNVREIRGVNEGMLVTLLLLMLEVPGSLGAVVPREALEIVGVGPEVGVGAGTETEEKKEAKIRMAKKQTSTPATETLTAVREATQGAAVVVRPAAKRCAAPDRCVAFRRKGPFGENMRQRRHRLSLRS